MAKQASKKTADPAPKPQNSPPRRKKEEEANAQPGPSGVNWLMISFLIVLFLVCGALGAFFFFSNSQETASEKKPQKTKIAYIEDPDGVLDGAVITLKPLTVNLLSTQTYLLLGVSLEFFDFSPPADVDRRIPPVQDAIVSLASRQSPERLLSEKGREAFRKEMLLAVNKALGGDNPVVEVYFTQFTVQ